MGNAFTCCESGHWDPHPSIECEYPLSRETTPKQPMDLPLSCYFISSGHNSYLTGNQLNSDSGTKTITTCLRKGCRVIELDVYNQQPTFSGPVCKHGGTLTKPVAFKECVAAVRANAFTASPYPVIITLEMHTDEKNQKDMADILTEVLGEQLYIPQPGEPGETWKSPEQLRHKVLIRANAGKCCEELRRLVYISNSKFVSTATANKSEKVTSSSFGEAKLLKMQRKAYDNAGLKLKEVPEEVYDDVAPASSPSWAGGQGGSARWMSPRKAGGSSRSFQTPPSASPRGASSGRDVQAVQRTERYNGQDSGEGGWEVEEEEDGGDGENQGGDTSQASGAGTLMDVYTYTARHLMRVYPGGLRFDSSNPDPMHAWGLGASLAALNWQKWDKALWINAAMFARNGGCGYVLKPDWMLQGVPGFGGPAAAAAQRTISGSPPTNPLPDRPAKKLRVHVHSAYADQGMGCMCFKDDLFLQIEICGMPEDCAQVITHTNYNSGRLIVERIYELRVAYPEVAVLLLRLMDDDLPGTEWDDTLGYWGVAVSELVPGSYWLHLHDPDNGQVRMDRWAKVTLEWVDDESEDVGNRDVVRVNGSRKFKKGASSTQRVTGDAPNGEFSPNPLSDRTSPHSSGRKRMP